MKIISKLSKIEFEVRNEDLDLYNNLGTEIPNITPDERNRLRISFRNFMNLSWTECAATKTKILSMYSDKFKVYSPSFWWTTQWDAKDYAQEYNSSNSLFVQLNNLMKAVPKLSTVQLNSENCDY